MSVLTISYPPELPVSACRDDIAAAISAHQVVVIAGETGSGKTTQLPKICLELGRTAIGHTQPRRIAATSVAKRIADELGSELGETVGYQVRFSDKSGKNTQIKVMTDGILLREITTDPQLRRYDTLIIDEAHERSLNIDFLLGYLKRLLPRRPDLKVVITSATIEPDRFARHFASSDDEVPILEVSGRTYPVDVRYRPLERDDEDHRDLDQIAGIDAAVGELWARDRGDILVFLPTERDIRDTADALAKRSDAEIVPLYARLSVAEQQRVFAPSNGRRIVLATNVAETSLTVPGIRYVIDTGTARISRYSTRTKVTRLPIEPVSQASARQRAGRCGRVAPGICIRLYSEADFDARPEYTDPEILRSNLAAVILSMLALRLGDITDFPFVQPPDQRAIKDGMAVLRELGAVTTTDSATAGLTQVGRTLSRLPVDPRLGRMLIAGHDDGCLAEMLVIVSALALPDVREFPADKREAANAAHRRHRATGSEFLSRVQLWKYLAEQREQLSGNQFRRQCEREFLHYLRIREWWDLHRQLTRTAKDMRWTVPALAESPSADTVGRAVLTGLLGNIGSRQVDSRDFLGTRGTKFLLFPGSELAAKPPAFVVAAELIETSRLFAHTVAAIKPEWVEQLAPDLVTRTYSEPHWSTKRGAVMAHERVSLWGVPLIAGRTVSYGGIDPQTSREIFIREALVSGRWRTRHIFFEHNAQFLADADDLEKRTRRAGVALSDDQLFDFYAERIPAEVVSTRHFDSWWKKTARTRPELLNLSAGDLAAAGDAPSPDDFPTAWQQGQTRLELRYHFEPGAPDDGVTVVVPRDLVGHVRATGFDWLVPGLRPELATALIKSLPKGLRKSMAPAQRFADLALTTLKPRSEPILTGLARELSAITGMTLTAHDFAPETLPAHLRMHFAVTDAAGAIIARDDRLDALQKQFGRPDAATAKLPVFRDWKADGIGTLADARTDTVAGQRLTRFPSLDVVGDGVRVSTAASAAARDAAVARAVHVLLTHRITPLTRKISAQLAPAGKLALSQSPYAKPEQLFADCTARAIADALATTPGAAAIRTPPEFQALAESLSPAVRAAAPEYFGHAVAALEQVAPLRRALDIHSGQVAADDVAEQLSHLVFDGFVAATPLAHLRELARYLTAARARLDALPAARDRDAAALATVDRVIAAWNQRLARLPEARHAAFNDHAHWLVEELRVSLFAQRLGTKGPVSEKRVLRAFDDFR